MASLFNFGKKLFVRTTDTMKDWSGYASWSSGARYFKQTVSKLMPFSHTAETERLTFAEACQVYGITDEMLQRKCWILKLQCGVFVSLALLIFFYGCYSLTNLLMFTTLISFLLTALMLSMAFKAHFWLFQITERKLGCTLKDWVSAVLVGGKL